MPTPPGLQRAGRSRQPAGRGHRDGRGRPSGRGRGSPDLGPRAQGILPTLLRWLETEHYARVNAALKVPREFGPDARAATPHAKRIIIDCAAARNRYEEEHGIGVVDWLRPDSDARKLLVAIGEESIPTLNELREHPLWDVRRNARKALKAIEKGRGIAAAPRGR
ncbi:MAG: hypothetical protein ACYTHK_00045 [Planctomycetota bacterium]